MILYYSLIYALFYVLPFLELLGSHFKTFREKNRVKKQKICNSILKVIDFDFVCYFFEISLQANLNSFVLTNFNEPKNTRSENMVLRAVFRKRIFQVL